MSIEVLLPGLIIAAAVGAVVYVVLAGLEERQVIRESLRQLEGYEVESVRDQELLTPLKQRALLPVLHGLTGVGRRFTPAGYVSNVRQKFVRAGRLGPDSVDRFLAVRVVTVLLIPVVFAIFYVFDFVEIVVTSGKMQFSLGALLMLALFLGPDAVLNRHVQERQLMLRRTLPDVLDLLVISVEAGLGFEQALDRVIDTVPGPLSEEFARMLGEIRAGASRSDSMRALDERTDVAEIRSFVLAILQADTFGVSIGRVLRAQADEMRIRRRQLAQERAQKAPVKMLIPMVFCIFPALFVIVLGPAVLNIMEAFGGQ